MTRPSERELRNAVASLDDDDGSHPVASLAILLSADEIQQVSDRLNLLRIDGELYQNPDIDCVALTDT